MAVLLHTFILMGLFMAFGGDTQEVGYGRLLAIAFVFSIAGGASFAALGPWIGLFALIPAEAVMVVLLMQFCYIGFKESLYIAGSFTAYLIAFGLLTQI